MTQNDFVQHYNHIQAIQTKLDVHSWSRQQTRYDSAFIALLDKELQKIRGCIDRPWSIDTPGLSTSTVRNHLDEIDRLKATAEARDSGCTATPHGPYKPLMRGRANG